jgi:hypothetical protein
MTNTTIKVAQATRDRLRAAGEEGMSFDEIINCLLDEFEKPMPHVSSGPAGDPRPSWVRNMGEEVRAMMEFDED